MSSAWRRRFQVSALVIAAPVVALVVAAQLGRWSWFGDLCSHWTLHAACLLFLASVVTRRGSPGQIVLILVAALALGPWIRAARDPRASLATAEASIRIPIACANLFDFNTEHRAVHLALRDQPVDLLGLEEIKSQDRAELLSDQRWPYQEWTSHPHHLNVALLSRYPLHAVQDHVIAHASILEALVDVDGRTIRVLLTHFSAPYHGPQYLERQDAQRALMTSLVQGSALPLLVMGDFNMTPGSHRWADFLDGSQLQRAPGQAPATWPSWLGPMGIPIDHMFVRGLGLIPLQALTIPGSDHRGVIGALLLPAVKPSL